jgi:predicted NBD/HSP70 family sugar kinase
LVSELVAGIDIGGSVTKVCLLADGEMLTTGAMPTVLDAIDSLGILALTALHKTASEAGVDPADITSIGIGVPGQVANGVVQYAANLGIDGTGFDLGGYVSSATQVVTVVENDMRVAAYGAFTHCNTPDATVDSLVYIGLGTGVSAGVVLSGEVYRGSRGLAGEFGHVPMGTGLNCACGSVGCLETIIGASGLRQSWDGDEVSSLFRSAADGDAKARMLADQAIHYLAQAMWWLAATYDPDIFFIGGGIGANAPVIKEMLAAKWAEMSAPSGLARLVLDPDRVRRYDLEEPVGAYGAALLAAFDRSRSGKRHETATWEEESIP